jgi:hypothetical protein
VSRIPHPANVPGDYYVEDGCCTMCTLPFGEAPELIGETIDPRGHSHCFVKCQPRNELETEHMVSAIQVAELRCIRYRGTDAKILSRLTEMGEAEVCDALSPVEPKDAT